MIIGTVRPEETAVHDTYAGFHQFHNEDQESHGGFEVFHNDGTVVDKDGYVFPIGWYWWPCFPGCLPEAEETGPFADSFQALKDADEFNPAIDWYFE